MAPLCFVGVDGDEPGSAAMEWALRRAVECDDPVVVIHVAEHGTPQNVRAAGRRLATALAAAQRLAPGVHASARLLHGSAARELARLGAPEDLLVLGTHKTGYLRGRAIGSKGVFIATNARSNVAVVPETSFGSRRGVIVGVDGLGPSLSAVRFAAREAERLGQELVLVHAVGRERRPEEDAAFGALREAAAIAAAAASPPAITTRVIRRAPADALLDAGRIASLIVIGPSHRDHATHVAGPVAHDVLVNIDAPVVLARAGG